MERIRAGKCALEIERHARDLDVQERQLMGLARAAEKEPDAEKRCRARAHLVKMDEALKKAKSSLEEARGEFGKNAGGGIGIATEAWVGGSVVALLAIVVMCKVLFKEECQAAIKVLTITGTAVAGIVGLVIGGVLAVGIWGAFKDWRLGRSRKRAYETQSRATRARQESKREKKEAEKLEELASEYEKFKRVLRQKGL